MRRRAFLAIASVPCAAEASANFSDELWKSIEPIYAKTLSHPFLAGLRDGSLPKRKFQFYLTQDALYLTAFAKALEALAAKAPRPDSSADFRRDAKEAIETELLMHKEVLASYGVSLEQAAAAEMAPVNYAYTNHLRVSCGQEDFAVGVAAVLPCYWIYWEVGKQLRKSGSRHAEYQRWINQYADPNYGKAVQRVIHVMNESVTSETRARAKRAFGISSRYEYLFWDMAWREEQWLL